MRNAATLSLGTATAQAVNVVVAPVLTRLYSPADLGALGLFTSFVVVAAVATSMSYELGIVSASNKEKAARLTWASMLLSIPVCAVCGIALYIMMHFQWLGYGVLPAYSIPIMVVTLLFISVFSNLRYWEIRQQHFETVARTTVVQQVTRSISQAVLGFAGIGSAGLLFGEMLGRGAGVGSLFRNAWPALRSVSARVRRSELVSALAENRNLAVYSLPSSLIDTLAANIPLPLLVQLYGSALGGQFSLMQRVLAVPLALIATSVADTFHSRIAVCAREKPGEMLGLFVRTSAGLFLLALGPALILFFTGDRLFALVFGEPWTTAGTLAGITAPLFLAQIIVSPLSRLVFVLRGQKSKLIYDLTLMAGILLIFGIAWRQKLSLVHTVWAITLVNILCYFVYYIVLLRIVIKARPNPATEAPRI
ncbi:MAG TPA: oligosaccharide flippase family protein [Candidatus Polarisedimenticolia bacterium]|nr:oligosaccharide flippase family protein [Candidatus Polarisedimenticolia bacterium]